jgi:hypothetical protein
MYGAKTAQELEKMRPEDKLNVTGCADTTPAPKQESLKYTLFAGHGWLFYHPGFFSRHRLLDGYLGVLGVALHHKALSVYHDRLLVLDLSLVVFSKTLLGFGLEYDPFPRPLRWVEVPTGEPAGPFTWSATRKPVYGRRWLWHVGLLGRHWANWGTHKPGEWNVVGGAQA